MAHNYWRSQILISTSGHMVATPKIPVLHVAIWKFKERNIEKTMVEHLKINIKFLSTKIHKLEGFPVNILSVNLCHDQNIFKFLPSLSCQPSQCFPKNLMEALTIRMQAMCPVSSHRLFLSLLCVPWYKRTQDLGGHLQKQGREEIIDIFAPN